jgi:predicted AAA+ superfamily ATPase
MGAAVETAFFKHVFTRYYQQSVGFSYWRGKKGHEIDIIAEVEGRLVPFEVKYRNQSTGWAELKGMVEFCQSRKVSLGYVITKEMADFGLMERQLESGETLQLIKIPAPLACYWLGKSEIPPQQE